MEIEESKIFLRLNGYIEFLRKIILNNSISQEKQDIFNAKIDSIVEKQKDKNLYLGIVGEFSSGKTTLINSLLNDNFLKTDAVQGTTTATTFFRYGDNIDLTVELKDGSILKYTKDRRRLEKIFMGNALTPRYYYLINKFKQRIIVENENKKSIEELIEKITTSDVNTSKVNKVDVYYPSDILKKGVVIIDTPGTDIDNKEHLKITEKAIREYCDSSLIIVPCEKPASQSLTNFLKDNIYDTIHRCKIFVTKIELLRDEKERKLVINNISKRISSSMLVDEVAVYEAPTLLYLEESGIVDKSNLLCRLKDGDKTMILKNYYKTKEIVFNGLIEQRVIIQTEKIIILINEILKYLEGELKILIDDYQNEHENLVANSITNLGSFTEEKKREHKSSLTNRFDEIVIETRINIDLLSQICIHNICDAVNSCTNIFQVQSTVKNRTLKSVLDEVISSITQEIKSESLHIYQAGNTELSEFEKDFTKIYNKLSLLKSGFINHAVSNKMVLSQLKKTSIGSFSIQLGTFDIVTGWMFRGQSLSILKDKVCLQIKNELISEFGRAKMIANNALKEKYEKVWSQLSEIIEMYMSQYGELVQKLICEDDRKKEILKKNQKRITQELCEISRKKEEIIEMKNNLKQLQ
jgi:GTPase SAR1 family protein